MEKMEMNWRQKLSNFWFYYKVHVIVAVLVIWIGFDLVKGIVTRVDYDYSVAIVTENVFYEDELACLKGILEENGKDRNGNGTVDVELLVYTLPQGEGVNPQTTAAGQTKLMADMQTGNSMIFLHSDLLGEVFEGNEPWENTQKVASCRKLADALSDSPLLEYNIGMRIWDGTQTKEKADKETEAYYYDSKELLDSLQ